jgi:alkylation response protein AidB-like acyl-CoA dehydrogenase
MRAEVETPMALDFSFTEEHEELRSTIRAFLADKSDELAVRDQMATDRGYDREVWTQMAEQLGLAGLIIPEEHGGAGFGYVELLIVMEEMGRALLCAPYLGTAVLSANALLHCADAATQKELLAGIASGEKIVSVAHAEPNGRWDLAGIEMRARAKGDGFELDGTKSWVLDGHSADTLLVVARSDDGLALFRVDASAEGVTRTLVPSLDLTRKLAHVEFAATPATRVSDGDQTQALEKVLSLTIAALAAEQVGGAQKCLEMSVEYAQTRLQFGRPIGSYQAIKHKCADMLVSVEFAKSAAYNACFAAAEGESLGEAAALAKSYCSESYFHAAADCIQIHGGMGFTWEHPAHLYFKRAKASDLLFGEAAHHREVLAELIGI